MTFLNRLRFRANWSLWVAGVIFGLVVFCLLTYLINPLRYAYDAPIAYPLAIVYHTIIRPLGCLTLLAFIPIVLIATARASSGRGFLYIVFLAIVGSILFCWMNSGEEVIFGFIFILVLCIIPMRQNLKNGIAPAILIMLSVVLLWVPLFGSFWTTLQHRSIVQFSDKTYNLALLSRDHEECSDNFFILYQCPNWGLMCQPIYKSKSYGECVTSNGQSLPEPAALITDSVQNKLYLQLGNQQFLVAPQIRRCLRMIGAPDQLRPVT